MSIIEKENLYWLYDEMSIGPLESFFSFIKIGRPDKIEERRPRKQFDVKTINYNNVYKRKRKSYPVDRSILLTFFSYHTLWKDNCRISTVD